MEETRLTGQREETPSDEGEAEVEEEEEEEVVEEAEERKESGVVSE